MYRGDEEWYHDLYDRRYGVGDIYCDLKPLVHRRIIPVSFYLQERNPDALCGEGISTLNRIFGVHIDAKFVLYQVSAKRSLPWRWNGINVIVDESIEDRGSIESYHGRGILTVSPRVLRESTGSNHRYAIAHGVGHGIFGYGHHGEDDLTPVQCLMDLPHSDGKRGGILCSEDMTLLQSLGR